jgi:hypothetical protein
MTIKNSNDKGKTEPLLTEITVKEFRSKLKTRLEESALVDLAGESMAEAIWLLEGKIGLEEMLEYCKSSTMRSLERRVGRLRPGPAAPEARGGVARS